ncbi:hypothetical protein BH11PSE3_BH11PSE3_12650 [soil metagenome]
MPLSRAIVWLDSREAKVFRFGDEDVAQARLSADAPFKAIRHRTGALQTGDLRADLDLLDRVIDALRGTRDWRLCGPEGARDYLLGYLDIYKTRDGHIARLVTQLAGVADVDHPTDAALLEQARV